MAVNKNWNKDGFVAALEELRAAAKLKSWAAMAARLKFSPALMQAYRNGDSQPTRDKALALAFLDHSVRAKELKDACREWIQLAGREMLSNQELQGLTEHRSPVRNTPLQAILDKTLEPLLAERSLPGNWLQMVLCRVSQEDASKDFREFQEKNPTGTVLVSWDYHTEGKLKERFDQTVFVNALKAILNPPLDYQEKWLYRGSPDVNVIVCLTIYNEKPDSPQQKATDKKIQKLCKDLTDGLKSEVPVLNDRFEVWGNRKLTPDCADRWLFAGFSSLRGRLLESPSNLEAIVPTLQHEDFKKSAPLWSYCVIDLSQEQVKLFIDTHEIKYEPPRLKPIEKAGDGWARIFPKKEKQQ